MSVQEKRKRLDQPSCFIDNLLCALRRVTAGAVKSAGDPSTIYLLLIYHPRVDKYRWIEALEVLGAEARQEAKGTVQ